MESASSAARTVECEKCNADVSVEQLRDHMRMHEAVLCECGTVYELQLIPFHKNNCACPAMSSIVCSRCRLTLGVRTFNVERFFSREQSFCPRCNDQVDVDGTCFRVRARTRVPRLY